MVATMTSAPGTTLNPPPWLLSAGVARAELSGRGDNGCYWPRELRQAGVLWAEETSELTLISTLSLVTTLDSSYKMYAICGQFKHHSTPSHPHHAACALGIGPLAPLGLCKEPTQGEPSETEGGPFVPPSVWAKVLF